MQPTKNIRRHCRAARQALTAGQQRAHAEAVARQVVCLRWLQRARRIGFYHASDGELNPAIIAERLSKRQWHLPVLRRLKPNRLWFARYRRGDVLIANRYRIGEPAPARRRLSAMQLDVLLVPVVAFDATGQRLGMGGGFYDRTLSALRSRHSWRRPKLIGLAHELQRIDALSPRPWDVRLDVIVTEAGCYYC